MTSFIKTTAAFLTAGTIINVAALATMKWWMPKVYEMAGLDYEEILSSFSISED